MGRDNTICLNNALEMYVPRKNTRILSVTENSSQKDDEEESVLNRETELGIVIKSSYLRLEKMIINAAKPRSQLLD